MKNTAQSNEVGAVAFDKDNFDGEHYLFRGVTYISERIFFPAIINGKKIMLEIGVDRPAKHGRYPVIILTHGRNGPFPHDRDINTCKYFDNVKESFLKYGMVVVQLSRRGSGLSEGSNMDEYKMTPIESGKEMVKDIGQAILYLKSKQYVDKNKVVIGGHSQGGWAALVATSSNLRGVKGTINFSGATNYRKQPWSGDWSRKASSDFIEACKKLAYGSKVPSLWIYGDQEVFHRKEDVATMYSTYNRYGGKATLFLLPKIGHNTISIDAQKIWDRAVYEFLVEIGMVEGLPLNKLSGAVS